MERFIWRHWAILQATFKYSLCSWNNVSGVMQRKWHVLHQMLDVLHRKQGVLQRMMGTSFQGMGFKMAVQLYCLASFSCCFKDYLEAVEVIRISRIYGTANQTLMSALMFLNLHTYYIYHFHAIIRKPK